MNVSFDLKLGTDPVHYWRIRLRKVRCYYAIISPLPEDNTRLLGWYQLDGMNISGMPPEGLRSLRGRVVSMIFQEPLSVLKPLMTAGAQAEVACPRATPGPEPPPLSSVAHQPRGGWVLRST